MSASMSTSSLTNSLSAMAGARSNSPPTRMWTVYLQCYFVTIATILGTGILGLPVTLAHSGLYPFLVTFILGFFIQSLLIIFFTDILQRSHAVQYRAIKEGGGGGGARAYEEIMPLNDMEMDEDFDDIDIEEEHESNGPVMAGHIIIPDNTAIQPPNLHLLGQLFLPCGLRQMFDVVIIIQFIAFLISYALAGSQAYGQVIGINHTYIIPVFVWILTFLIVFGLKVIQPIVSLLTFAKGSLILGTVAVTFYVGASIQHEISNDFTYIGQPLLMGTVALGGVINVMPFLYAKINPVTVQVRRFRLSVLGGLLTCAVINILWSWAVLDIVPQTNSCFSYEVKHNNSFHTVTEGDDIQHRGVCSYNLSLANANKNGEISTIPLTEIIHHLYPNYDWVALLVQLFIMISITVSYLTIGAAMHHTLSGWIESVWNRDRITTYTSHLKSKVSKRCGCCTAQCEQEHCMSVCRCLISLLAFTVVFIVAMLNPKGFTEVLDKAASSFLNLEAGLFVFLMVRCAHNTENRKLKIPLPLSRCFYHFQYLLPAYFGFAVFYAVFVSIYGILYPGVPLPWENKAGNHLISGHLPSDDHHDYPSGSLYVNDSVPLEELSDFVVNTTHSWLVNATENYWTTTENSTMGGMS